MTLNIRVPDQIGGDAAVAALKSSPPVAVGVMSAAGWGLQDWVYMLTIVWLVVQIGYLAWKWVRELLGKRSSTGG